MKSIPTCEVWERVLAKRSETVSMIMMTTTNFGYNRDSRNDQMSSTYQLSVRLHS